MSQIETYRSQRGGEMGAEAGLAAAVSPFTIVVRFLGGLTENQKNAFKAAADRWTSVIVGDLPSIQFGGEEIDDIVIEAQGRDIDGPSQILGQASPTHLRPQNAGQFAFLPAKGIMTFDTADMALMEQRNTLGDVITHEMGHVLGVGTVWSAKGLLRDRGTSNPTFAGERAMAEYGRLQNSEPKRVPVENTGGPGTADSHWRETIFRNELMSGFISQAGNPISRVTVASLADIGYEVNMDAAEAFELQNLFELAEGGLLTPHVAPIDGGIMLPIIPIVLPAN